MQQKKRLIIMAVFILTFMIINLIMAKSVQAATQTKSTEIDKIDEEKYPGIKELIQDLQTKHPNWNFKILYTGLSWEEVIVNEYVGHGESPRNLVPVGTAYAGDWICESCTENKPYDNGKWRCASKSAIQYMMDARNSINDSDIFQFMELTYQECTFENIKSMVVGTFLENDNYINAIIEAGKKHNVSPYYIVALAVQEQGKSGTSTISGKYSGYEGYYNIFNINATGNNSSTIIKNALSYAKQKEWTTLELAIDGGVEKISTSYIARGQDTLYLQKFDVDNSDGKLYWHQYQQNILAAQNEGVTIRETFKEINAIESEYTFVIPLYENAPKTASPRPLTDKSIDTTNAEQVKVNVRQSINLRATASGEVIGVLNAEEVVFRLEKATEKINGTYWDKVMKVDGTIGYVARETYDYEPEYKLYLIPIEEETEEKPDEDSGKEPEQNPEEKPPVENPEENPNDEPTVPEEDPNLLEDISNEKIKVENEHTSITIVPGTTIQGIIDLLGKEITAKDKEGNILEKTSILKTGITLNDKYKVIVMGDVSGDGIVDARDSLRILKYSVSSYVLENEFAKAADLNKDGIIDARDSLRVLKYSVQTFEIKL